MNLKKLIYGIYPRSERLRVGIGRWERGNLDSEELRKIIKDEKNLFYEMMVKQGIDFYTDPLFNWHDIFRPIASRIDGLKLGPLTRYFETNTFYRKPVVNEIKGIKVPLDKENQDQYDLPCAPYLPVGSSGYVLFLPGIGTFFKLSETNLKWNEFSEALLDVYDEIIKNLNAERVFFYEEIPLDLGIYGSFSSKVFLRIPKIDNYKIYSGFSIYSLISPDPYYSSKYSNLPGYLIINSMTTMIEKNLIENLKKYSQDFSDLLITHNNYFDFLPRKIADLKVGLLGGAF